MDRNELLDRLYSLFDDLEERAKDEYQQFASKINF